MKKDEFFPLQRQAVGFNLLTMKAQNTTFKLSNDIPYFGPHCSQCRHGEHNVPAQSYVEGRIDGRPYRANLCDDHVDVLIGDGLEVRRQTSARRSKAQRAAAAKRANGLANYLARLRRYAALNSSNIALMNLVQQHLVAAQIDAG
jgi:hypothetical protein